jgi:SAM-dependent methyltransferase
MNHTLTNDGPSLEQLLEMGMLPAEILHPGGLETTRELAELCEVGPGKKVLDVASGTGEAACFLAETFQCNVAGIDASEYMIERAREKAQNRNLDIEFRQGDAHALPFQDDAFDAVISECTTCVLDKPRAIREMARVTKPGGHVGIHDLCWKEAAPKELKQQLAELENEHPETLDGWQRLFEEADLTGIVTREKSGLIASWTKDVKQQLGLVGQLKIYWKIVRQWGFRGLRRIMESERVFRNEHLGYGLIVGTKPPS